MIKRYIDLEPDNRKGGGYTIKNRARQGRGGAIERGSYTLWVTDPSAVPFRPECKSMMMLMLFMGERERERDGIMPSDLHTLYVYLLNPKECGP